MALNGFQIWRPSLYLFLMQKLCCIKVSSTFVYLSENMSFIWMPQQKMDCMSPLKLINLNVHKELFLYLKWTIELANIASSFSFNDQLIILFYLINGYTYQINGFKILIWNYFIRWDKSDYRVITKLRERLNKHSDVQNPLPSTLIEHICLTANIQKYLTTESCNLLIRIKYINKPYNKHKIHNGFGHFVYSCQI